jgi:DNA-binding transcriptional LysR family regulator
VTLFPDWEEERFPLYAYYPSRQYLAPKTRAFLEFLSTTVQASHSRHFSNRRPAAQPD